MQEIVYLEGRALFIWGAYGITVVVLVLSIVFASLRKNKILKEIKEALEQ